jgi:methyltransferase (TIGR00027 family)
MEAGRPSSTAVITAAVRARYQSSDPPRIFDDPLAARIVGHDLDEPVVEFLTGIPDRVLPYMVVRYRFAQDALERAAAAGVDQVVILGAGLDTFGCRNPYEQVTVFEVDHPETQAWKRNRLATAGIDVPPSLRFTPIDFERETLSAGLTAAGFDRDHAAFFVWLGVVYYLTRSAVTATLRFIGDLDQGAEVVFDYREPLSTMSSRARERYEQGGRRTAAVGEPLVSFFTETQMAEELRTAGFDEIEDLTLPTALARYSVETTSERELAAGGHLVHAAHTARLD